MSDLISRQSVINTIANTCFWLSADNWEELVNCINSIPSVENKEEFDGMTNGEVIQALFPYVKTEDTSFNTLIGTNLDKGYVPLHTDWWNEPYKAESEEE